MTESITVKRRTKNGEDAQGNPTYTIASTTVTGCGIGWEDSGEDVASFGTRAVTGATIYAPAGTVFEPSDVITIRGVDYTVVGDDAAWTGYYSGTPAGVVIGVKRAA